MRVYQFRHLGNACDYFKSDYFINYLERGTKRGLEPPSLMHLKP
jgi:hypothetical protein